MTTKNTIESPVFNGTAMLVGGETPQRPGDSTEPHNGFDSYGRSKVDLPRAQVDPSGKHYASHYIHYEFTTNKKIIAEIIVTNTIHDPPHGFDRGMEYWKIHGKKFNSDEFNRITAQRFEREASTKPPFKKKDASFWCPLEPQWIAIPNDADKLDENHSGFRTCIEWSDAEERWTGTIAWMKPNARLYVFSFPNDGPVTLERRRVEQGRMAMNSFTFALRDEHTLCRPTS